MVRIGLGFDLHRLESHHQPLIVGGVEVPHDRGPVAHSDGDVLLHALTDALLGSIAAGDIGSLFPDTDPAWAGSDSRIFVEAAMQRVRAAGYRVGNVDVCVILQRPKLSPHIDAIRGTLAELLDARLDHIWVKAKTNEGVDALGEGRAVACHVVVLVEEVEPP